MKAVGEVTNVNIRVGPTVHIDGKYEVAVNGVSSDRKTMVIKCLSPEGKFTFEHAAAIREYVAGLGKTCDWESKRKDLGMSVGKKRLPKADSVTTVEGHRAAIALGLEQEAAGHYKFSNITATEHEVSPGVVNLVIKATRTETNPNQPAS